MRTSRVAHDSEEFYFVGERNNSTQKPPDGVNNLSQANADQFGQSSANVGVVKVGPTITVRPYGPRGTYHSNAMHYPPGEIKLSEYVDKCHIAFLQNMKKHNRADAEHGKLGSSLPVVQKKRFKKQTREITQSAILESMEELIDESYKIHLDLLMKGGNCDYDVGELGYDLVDECYLQYINSLIDETNLMDLTTNHSQTTEDSVLELVDQSYLIYLDFLARGGNFDDYNSPCSLTDLREEMVILISEKTTRKVKNEVGEYMEVQNSNFYVIPDEDADVVELTRKEKDKTLITINDDGGAPNVTSLKGNSLESSLNYNEALEKHVKKKYNEEEMRNLLKMFRLKSPVVGSKDLRSGCKTFNLPVAGASYEDYYEDLADIIWDTTNKTKVLKLLRGFFYWLEHVAHGNMPPPWKDPKFLACIE